MEVPREVLDRYTDALDGIAEQGKAALSEALARIDYDADPATVRRGVLAAMEQTCGASSEVSARTAAAFYDGMRAYVTDEPFTALASSQRVPAATEQSVRAFLAKLFEGDEDEFERLCLERVDYEVRRAAGECVRYNVGRDQYGDTRYARVPTGTETCAFCLMLASRGPVYHTAESAGLYDHYHPHCDCRIVPVWGTYDIGPSRREGATSIEGYDPDALYEQYLRQIKKNPRLLGQWVRSSEAAHRRNGRTEATRNRRKSGYDRNGADLLVQEYGERMLATDSLDRLNEIMDEARKRLASERQMYVDGNDGRRWDRLWDTYIAALDQVQGRSRRIKSNYDPEIYARTGLR